jgi:hypothetical protein
MRIYTKSLRYYVANFDHKFNLNCHEVFNITKAELQLAYQRNAPPVIVVIVCYSVAAALLEQGPLRPRDRSLVLPNPILS